MRITLADLRRYAVSRSLFKPTTLGRAIGKLGFVQADPIRAPARAQDLTLRHRVVDYRAGDLERRYPKLDIEEDFLVNYGFMPRSFHTLMHPRKPRKPWSSKRMDQARAVLDYIRDRGAVHPRDVDAHFAHGKIKNWFGGSSNATTHLLDEMAYRGMLRIARRESGTRIYAARDVAWEEPDAATGRARFDQLVDVVANKYAPLPAASFGQLLSLLCGGTPQWRGERAAALARAKARHASARVEGVDWYWPATESPRSVRWQADERVRLMTPFDPVVWDRRRFEILWGWAYRFEAYTPPTQRKRGYYALPLLHHDRVIGWGNVRVADNALRYSLGFAEGSSPRGVAFHDGLAQELSHLAAFLRIPDQSATERQSASEPSA